MKWRILLSDFRCRKKHRGQVGERRHQTILILILIQDHMYTGFFLGFMFITWVTPTSRQHISFLLKRLTHPIDLTKLNRTPVIGCGVLLAGRMTAWCSVIQLVVTWIVKEPSPIKQATVSVLCPVLFLPFALFFCFSYTTLLSLLWPKKASKVWPARVVTWHLEPRIWMSGVQSLARCFVPETRNFTPLCLSSPGWVNEYRRHTAGG